MLFFYQLREKYAGERFVPRDLRAKTTRAIRRRLTPEQQNKKTTREIKRDSNFPKRKFAVKAL
jgi:large subunit ribosomal protein L35e